MSTNRRARLSARGAVRQAANHEDMVLWVVSLRRLRDHYQSVLATSYRKRMTWGHVPSADKTAKVRRRNRPPARSMRH